ncbi:MAG: endonuclease/exonuclease/phosphatase family protein [Verrucomicrobiota bacterium]
MLLPVFKVAGWLALLAGLLLQLWLKDRHVMWAVLFYGMPKPCLAGLAFVLLLLPRQRVWQRAVAGVFMISITSWWALTSWSPGKKPLPEPSNSLTKDEITLLYWNLCRPKGLDAQAVELVKELNPQIAAFVEPGPELTKLLPAYEQALPGYTAAWMPRGVLWLSRLPSRYRERGKLDGLGAYARFEVHEPGPPFQVVVADVHPSLMHSREQQLKEVLAQSQDRDDTIFVGDFNTPFESVYFDVWRTRFTHAFSAAGSGFRETWPIGLPLLSIDHIWAGKAWEVVETRKIWRLTGSDHAALFVRLRRR